ncbi:dienelactone hydrolase family protein [Polaribacter cellanae]|uniref:Dienelactone hydrolase family protein n=1 Tax=Polaribacter cellanae TaxID=2818493 RepID=A0A975CND9_9FLAO|nr:dienelactone hydrolase family protein [Polaribacter cellanae]QTE21849.1 dienelactone hydrolase family protein [Polaribacter cellanae]QTE24220.1 dienelactone hydrolase family protein [Polaribacter cellanae]
MKHKTISKKVHIQVKGSTSKMSGYLAQPETDGKFPSVIIGMEIFGVNGHIKDITNKIAKLGYIAIAVDFYHRTEPNLELSFDTEGRNKGMELMNQLSREEVLKDVKATMDFLKSMEKSTKKIGFIGFSIGGHIAYLAATKLDLSITICFYAGWIVNKDIKLSQPEPTVTLTSGIAKNNGQLYYFVGGQDSLITKEQLELMTEALTSNNVRHEIIVYPQAKHGFFCEQRPLTFDKSSRDNAWERIQKILKNKL